MLWVHIGRERFDLDEVVLVSEAVGENEPITITLKNRTTICLVGEEAQQFLLAFDEHTVTRSIGRSPPRVLTPTLVVPGRAVPNTGHTVG